MPRQILLPLMTMLASLLLGALATPARASQPTPGLPVLSEAPTLPLPEGAEIVAESDRFRFVAFPDAAAPARAVAARAEGLRDQLVDALGQDYPGLTEVRVARSRSAFAALQPPGSRAVSWAVGMAYPRLNLIVLDVSARGGRQPPQQVLLHEISHLALGRLTPGGLPRWFLEGMAVFHAGESDAGRYATLATATLRGDHVPLEELSRGWPEDPVDVQLAYAEAVDFVGWLFREHGKRAMHEMIRATQEGASFDQALETSMGAPLWKLERAWHDDLRVRFTWLPILASGGTLWTLTTFLFLWAYLRRRRQARTRLREMELDELHLALSQASDPQLSALVARLRALDPDLTLLGDEADPETLDAAVEPRDPMQAPDDEENLEDPEASRMPYLH